MRQARFIVPFLTGVAVLCQLNLSCSSTDSPLAGGTSETTNGITAAIQRPDGAPAAHATVRIRPSDYLVSKSRDLGGSTASIIDTVTDSDGRFLIGGISADHYSIEVTDELTAAVLITCEVAVGGDTLDLGTHTIAPFATLRGMVAPDSATGTVTVGVFGLDRSAPIDSLTGAWSFSDLPPGAYTMRISPSSPEIGAAVIDAPPVSSGSSIDLPPVTLVRFTEENYSQWTSSRAIRINTSSSGAGISEDVHSFPLLVRLSATNFSFPSARTDGRDVRFSKQDGTRLRYEIEQWDFSAQQAVIWVLVDTIRGNDSTSLAMHWGAPTNPATACADFSNGAAVFDSTRFAGAWHLGGSHYLSDATPFGNAAVDHGTMTADGAIGGARYFDGKTWVSVPDAPSLEPASFTLSCWFRRNGPQGISAKLVNKGNTFNPFQSYTLEFRDPTTIAGFQVATQDTTYHTLITQPVVANARWYHLAGTFDAATGKGKLYLDGSVVDSFAASSPIQYYPTAVHDLILGSVKGNHAFFTGAIDEVLLARTALSPAWMMLCEKSQRSGATVVMFR